MNKQDKLQAVQYKLPYHHIPRLYTWPHQLEYEVYLEYLKQKVKVLDPLTILDVGCGDGRFLYGLGRGLGVDLNYYAIQWAKAFGVDAYCMDARDLNSQFELVTAIEVLEHIEDGWEEDFIEVLARRAKRDILILVPSDNIPTSAKHYRHYNPKRMIELAEPHMDIKGIELLIEQPKWWSVLEKIPLKFHEQWLMDRMRDKLYARPGKERHILLWGRV